MTDQTTQPVAPATESDAAAAVPAAGGSTATATLTLTPPDPVTKVEPSQAASAVGLDAKDVARLDAIHVLDRADHARPAGAQ